MNENTIIANKIKALRLSKQLLQKDIAVMLNLSENAYSRIENGHTQLTIETLYRICERLQVDIAEVMDVSKKNIHNTNSNIIFSQNDGTFHVNITPTEIIDLYNKLQEGKVK